MITADEVKRVLRTGAVIEDYPDDPRGHSCLLFGRGKGKRPVHVVCAPQRNYLAIITAYIPSAREWESDFRTRRRP